MSQETESKKSWHFLLLIATSRKIKRLRFCFTESQVISLKNCKFLVDDVTGDKISSVKQSVIFRMTLLLKCSSMHKSRQLFYLDAIYNPVIKR